MLTIDVGISDQDGFTTTDPRIRRRLLRRVADAGLDHVTMGDHVSFHGGTGFDGMITASTLLASHDRLPVLIGVYLLGLRHPMLAARQLSTLAQTAPGRLTLGVGVAGEDRAEVSNAGVDPASRGRRLDEALSLVRQLLAGEEVTFAGEFFRLEAARILPSPQPPVPIVIGGKGDVAVRRTAELGDGWLGMFCSPRRFAETRQRILQAAADRGRQAPSWFGVSVWCGLDGDAGQARELAAAKMERLYRLPYEKFQHLAPAGTPKQVAEFVYPFVESGAGHVTLVPAGRTIEAEIDAVAEVGQLLRSAAGQACGRAAGRAAVG
ncbi:MAG TPA: LLM class flavin-dependent oxidoreductase [Trebonia sp.]|jgi:alkanesulfonate monooxygenase SsuD/methylene tetrahydromethanopterin reductase-like flavin-dependent oxidoreductase (luciferase family)|nr:LLM class flavin-dependent oxidoreductase [Trebonia sp.]